MVEGLDIKTYNRASLAGYIVSDDFLHARRWPVSFNRALSLLNNPRLEAEDVILITAEKKGRLIAYRTVMSDYILNGDKKIKAGWICGTWVHPSFRRRKIATALFSEIHRLWKGRLMYTNYAPASKKVYDKTGVFGEYAVHEGMRFYVRADLSGILPKRFPVAGLALPLLKSMDLVYNYFVLPFVTDPAMKSRLAYRMEMKNTPDADETELLFRKSLTGRTAEDMKWINTFPWVMEMSEKNAVLKEKYFFSAVAKPFRQYFCSVNKDESTAAIAMITIKNSQLKMPYYYSADGDLSLLADLLFTEAWKNGITHIDIFDEALAREMSLKPAYYAWRKSQERKYMVSKDIITEFPHPSAVRIQDGEGDVVFV